MNKLSQQGFTLIELMISLTLGLILVAVAIQLIISGQMNYRIQNTAAAVQDSGVFGLNAVTKSIRLANHGNAGAMNDETLYGGVVLSAQTTGGAGGSTPDGNLKGLKQGSTLIAGDNYISKNAQNDSAVTTYPKSDQLVIVYQAPENMMTCTGRNIKGSSRDFITHADGSIELVLKRGWYVVERYYIKKRTDGDGADLYCSDALFTAKGEPSNQTYTVGTTTTTIAAPEIVNANYGSNNGEMIAQNVEYLRVQLMVRNNDNTTAVIAIDDYLASAVDNDTATVIPAHRPAITGIKLGMLTRSNEKVSNVKDATTYQVLDQSLSAPSDKYMRHVYTTAIALRNGGLGDIIQ